MVPAWVRTVFVILTGGIFACYIGSSLPEYEMFGVYLLSLAIACTLCAVVNNLPLLMALGIWYPFAPPVPVFGSFPTFGLVVMWIAVVKFFRLCMSQTLPYVPSFNWLLLACFAWVPIRFILNPVHSFGATVQGGSGVSGASAYFGYMLAGVTLISTGAIMTTRDSIISFYRWCLRAVFVVGVCLLICAFIPATSPFLTSMGMYAAGEIEDGVQRLVALPGYGLFLFTAALCPALFRLNKFESRALLILAVIMMVVGGNRSAFMAALLALPTVLFLRKKTHALVVSVLCVLALMAVTNIWVAQLDVQDISPMARSLGVLNSKIDEASGGKASADWRYAVWQSGIDKILEHPIIGKGFGNIDQRHLSTAAMRKDDTDFDSILAGGEAHNGFIVSAYGFGVPFTLGLTLALLLRTISHGRAAIYADEHDPELRDLNAFFSASFATTFVVIYTAADFSIPLLWLSIGMGFVLENVTKRASVVVGPPVVPSQIKPRHEQMFPQLARR